MFRRQLSKSELYTRQVRNDEESLKDMEKDGSGYSRTGLVAAMRQNGLFWQEGEVSIYLAESMGYCWGVERAVQMAYESRKAFPDSNLHLTNEIIHNPQINDVISAKNRFDSDGLYCREWWRWDIPLSSLRTESRKISRM